jgi:hypothetical protein
LREPKIPTTVCDAPEAHEAVTSLSATGHYRDNLIVYATRTPS